MNNETNDARHRDEAAPLHAGACERGGDLVAYLYGEVGADEAQSFRRHLSACVSCREELDAFGEVREGVAAWREEALRVAPSPASDGAAQAGREPRVRSALAALREFFALSPLWLRAGGVAAALLFCALAALTLARVELRWDEGGLALSLGVPERVVTRNVEVAAPGGVTREQLNLIVAAHERETAELRSQLEESRTSVRAQVVRAAAKSSTRDGAPVAHGRRGPARSKRGPVQLDDVWRRPSRSRQLAGYDEGAPRLYDLLREIN